MSDKNRLYPCSRCHLGSADGIVGTLTCGATSGFSRALTGSFWLSAFSCKMA
ncbi:hypothetical protein ECE128010_5329 [Escherichia coli E128010]|nr:hypothetical protein ECE128010_5329 [Escherichia coli E128010]